MKKWIVLLLALAICLSMAACGGNTQPAESTPTTNTPAETQAPTEAQAPTESQEAVSYTYEFDGMMGKETAKFDLAPDGTCQFSLPGNPVMKDVYAGTYTREGDTVTISGLTNVDASSDFKTPGLWDWIVDGNATITVDDAAGTFAPAGGAGVAAGVYTYEFDGMMGKETAQFDLAEDGTCQFSLPGNPMLTDVYAGTYTSSGNTVTITGLTNVDPSSDFKTPGLWDWIVDGNATITVDVAAGTFVPAGSAETGGTELPNGLTDVAYATTSPAQVCDIYTPEGVEKAPVIVLVHGGGFAFGDQSMAIIRPVIKAAVANGYAVVSVDYRKSSEAAFPGALADVKAAVRFVRANADAYGFDAERITIWGESAGAYLSLMTALTPEVAELNGDVTDNEGVSSAVTALVTFYAPVEFWTMDAEYAALGNPGTTFATDSSFESKFLGQAIGADQEKTYTTYWETYADQLPKDFALSAWVQVGDSDMSVPYTQSQNFASRLAGVLGESSVHFNILEGADHEDAAFYTDENLGAIFAWLDSYMKG